MEGPRLTLSRLSRGEQGRVFFRSTGVLSGSRSFNLASFPGGRPRAMARPRGEADDSQNVCVCVFLCTDYIHFALNTLEPQFG